MMPLPISVFDPALPGLGTALDPSSMSSRLRELLESQTTPSPHGWRVVGVDVVKHKLGRRCSLAYTVEGPSGRGRLFAKTFKNDRGASIFVNMAKFAQAIAQKELVVPRPLGYLPDIKLLVTEFLEGQSMAVALYEGRSEEPARRMATAIAVLHGCGVACARKWNPAKEIRNTAEWVTGLYGRSPAAPGRGRVLLQALESWSGLLPSDPETPVHRDFYPEQIWDCGCATALLDLDDTRSGDPAMDLGNFLAHLRLRPMQFPETARGCERARPAFLDEYLRLRPDQEEDRSFQERVRFYEATALLRLSGVYGARDHWAKVLPSRLLDACESVMKDEGAGS